MDITYLGKGSVKLSGKQISVVTDPETDKKVSADVIVITDVTSKANAGEVMVIDGPGEYEIKGSLITGVPAQLHIDEDGMRATAYSIEVDGVSVGVLGNIAPKLTSEQQEALGGVDVLVVPVGGNGLTLDATAATQVISQIEPKFVIPVHYDDGVSKYDMPQEKVDKFLAEMGGTKPEVQAKFKVTDKDLPLETTVVLLEVSK